MAPHINYTSAPRAYTMLKTCWYSDGSMCLWYRQETTIVSATSAEPMRRGGRLPERLIVRERVWFACKKLKGYSVSTKWELLLLGTSPRVSTWRNHTWSNLPDLPLCIGNRLWMGSSALAVGECRTEGDLYILLHSATAKIYLKLGDVHAHH